MSQGVELTVSFAVTRRFSIGSRSNRSHRVKRVLPLVAVCSDSNCRTKLTQIVVGLIRVTESRGLMFSFQKKKKRLDVHPNCRTLFTQFDVHI